MYEEKSFRRGDIYYVDRFGYQVGAEQHSGRPAVIVSDDDLNDRLDTVEIVYCTTQPKVFNKYHVDINSTKRRSTVLCEQVTTISKQKLNKFMARCTDIEIEQIGRAIAESLKIGGVLPEYRKADCQDQEIDAKAEIIRLQAECSTYKEMYEKLLKEMCKKNNPQPVRRTEYRGGYGRRV